MFETLAALFFAHVLADYVLQTEKMVQTKDHVRTLALHTLAVFVTALIALGSADWRIALLAAIHILIDIAKTLWVKKRKDDSITPYLVDQIAHLVAIVTLAAVSPSLWTNGIWANQYGDGEFINVSNWAPEVMLFIAGIVYATKAGGFAVQKLLNGLDSAHETSGYPQSGPLIGNLERGLVFVGILAGTPEAIGFLIATKAVMRFQSGTTNEKRYEYIFIGTLASFSWAIAISILILTINNGLNGTALLEIIPPKD